MYRQNPKVRTSLKGNNKQLQGETIESKMARMMQQGADMNDVSELIFTERKDGVIPETDVRHDRWETAIEAVDLGSKAHLAKRDERHNPKTDETAPGGEGKTDDKVG